jgi:hypothetical protein
MVDDGVHMEVVSDIGLDVSSVVVVVVAVAVVVAVVVAVAEVAVCYAWGLLAERHNGTGERGCSEAKKKGPNVMVDLPVWGVDMCWVEWFSHRDD